MEQFTALSACPGVAIGKIWVYDKGKKQVKRKKIEDVSGELERLQAANEKAMLQLEELHEKALTDVGEVHAAIFETHQMMLSDEGFKEAIAHMIKSLEVNAEYAIAQVGDQYAEMFANMSDDYMQAREADVRDVTERLLGVLSGEQLGELPEGEPVIVVAEDLAPSETIQFDKDRVLAFVTRAGSINSHSAILARTLDIPALVKTELKEFLSLQGKSAIVDAEAGVLIVEPDEETLQEACEKKKDLQEKRELLQTLKGKATITKDGKKVELYANIGNSKDLGAVLENDAAGIGLFRSEFLYLERNSFPTEEEQFQVYKHVAEIMAEKPVIIRTMDIGADKKCDYFALPKEENPALGMRAIRIGLTRPDIFKTQLRALLRAAVYGNLQVMYPMITGVIEWKRIQKLVSEIETELQEQGISYRLPKQGVMIETPAAVMMSEELAAEVDFFSIGTNDLTQYTLAVDRQNASLEEFYDPHHPAILKMLQMVVDSAHKHGIWVGICGELGGDLELTETFLRMGVDELSVSARKILPLRQHIRELDLSK